MTENFQSRNSNLACSSKMTASEDVKTFMVGLFETAAQNVVRKAENSEVKKPAKDLIDASDSDNEEREEIGDESIISKKHFFK